jgi:hypothetical protein
MVKIDEGPLAPDLLAQLLPGDHVTRMGQQYQQDLERLTGQPDAQAVPAQFARSGIDVKRPECRAK